MINIKALRVTRTLFYAAEKEGRFEGKNPFRHITLKGRTGNKQKLSIQDIEKIRERAEITTPITTHIARHSIADFMRAKGVSIYAISKALGHANIRVTEKYLKGFDSKEVDDALKGLFS